jgi:protease-4
MKNFIVSFLAALTAIIISFIILLVFLFSLLPEEKPVIVHDNSVLHLTLSGNIEERAPKNPFEGLDLGGGKATGLNDILSNIAKAKNDSSIRGIFLDLSSVGAGFASVEEIRNALLDFKRSGKFIFSYAELYTTKAYYLATVSDKLCLNPEGLIEFKGLSAQIMFYKGLLEKLDVDVQIFRHGKFKSAVEPFDLEKMSDANRLQTLTYVKSIWTHVLEGIAATRGTTVDALNKLADNMSIQRPWDCLTYKLADDTLYKDQFLDLLREKLHLKPKDKLHLTEMGDYSRVPDKKRERYNAPKIAVIYAAGDIAGGEGDNNSIGSEGLSKTLRDARNDTTIKAIVLRVNSPGGSALASEVIWREVMLTKKVKPVIVSMGDVAASGGYYISCCADRIFAQPNTITGSIGVFGVLPNLQRMYSSKFGITIDTVNTNKHAHLGTLNLPLTPEEGAVILKGVEDIYGVFLKRVADGRKMSTADVDSIGQGRVWTGNDALKIGLVDELGGLPEAIAYAVKTAKMKDHRIIYLPKQKEPLEQLLERLSGNDEGSKQTLIKNALGEQYIYYQHMKELMEVKGVQTRMTYDVIIY